MAATERSARQQDTTSQSSFSDPTPDYDIVGIGFGAAQLATAIANAEAPKPLNTIFFERKPSFSWHTGSHMARTRMETAFVYDLATLRNPRTSFSYVNYLLKKNRLVEFANSDQLNPLREEFDDYMKWCAGHFEDQVRYNNEVTNVTQEAEEGQTKGWKVSVRDAHGKSYTIRARSIIAPSPSRERSTVSQPLTAIDFLSGQRIISMNEYVARREELRGKHEPRINVSIIGSGAQTAEILNDVLSCPRLGNVTVVTNDESMAPLTVLNDPTPPAPELCSLWAKPADYKTTNVTGASELIQAIYMRGYEKHVQTKGEFRLRVILGQELDASGLNSDFVIRESVVIPRSISVVLQNLDPLILGCKQKSESLEEVQFKRGAVANGCRLWLVSSKSEGGRTMAKDVALTAGEIMRGGLTDVATSQTGGPLQARI